MSKKQAVTSVDLETVVGVKHLLALGAAKTQRASVSPTAAFNLLVKEGIITKQGKLSKNYRSAK